MNRRLATMLTLVVMGVVSAPGLAAAATQTVYYYPDSDGWPEASLSLSSPTYGGPMYDIDGNGKEGRRLDKSDKGMAETDDKKYHEWSVNASGLEVTGAATFTVWFADKSFNEGDDNRIQVYLLDCGSSSCSAPLATATKDVAMPDGDGVFAPTTLTFPAFAHTFASGRSLVLRLMVDKDNSDDDMTFAYDTAAYKTRLKLSKVVPTPTTTTTPTTTSTTAPTTTTTGPGPTTSLVETTSTSPDSTSTTVAEGSTTTTTSPVESTTTSAAAIASPPMVPPSGLQPNNEGLDTEKSNLVVRTTPAQRGVFVSAASIELSPVEGLMVSFLTVAETVKSQFFSAIGLGLIMASLLVIGLARRAQESEEESA